MEKLTVPQVTDSGTARELMYALRGRYRFLDALPVGRSVLGREIHGLLLGGGRQRVLYAAAFHGQEWMTAWIALRLCEDISEALQRDGRLDGLDIRQALSGRSLLFVPLVNPDGVDIAIHGSRAAGCREEEVRRLGGDTPGLWQANARGVDINHNFNAGWVPMQEMMKKKGLTGPAPRQWCGPAPESEPETAAMVGLCARHRFRHVLALHSQGEEIYWRYGDHTPEQARMMADILGDASGYRVADPEGMASHGGFKDWFIDATGRPGFTIELGLGRNPLPVEEFEGIYRKAREMLLLGGFL